ncbi:MAG: ATP-binding protein [Deltaproteobacteria bacterium]|nr:ATP-binding protein [Deltaproteobacteria bacterium]
MKTSVLKRKIDQKLVQWKKSRSRRPLLIRGARQVGKTYSVTQFGKKQFGNCVNINFEERPEFAKCFDTLIVDEILERIAILTDSEIKPGETLLFLDEIQECPSAIIGLRYFYEKLPELHVIGAGSLVEMAFKSENFRMPVGRISSLFMEPLSFTEFLEAIGRIKLKGYLEHVEMETGVDPIYRPELELALRKYLMIGGMPGIVAAYVENGPPEEIKLMQTDILQTYHVDFAKYASTAKHKYLKDVFQTAPRLIGNQCKYVHINPHVQSRDLKEALTLLTEAKCLYQVFHSAGQGIPLESQINPKKFKLLFLDVGIMQRALGLDSVIMLEEDLMTVNRGNVMEQFAGQQLLAAMDPFEERRIHFWAREKKSSQAEVDFLTTYKGMVFPMEVKSGKSGTLKSLRLFLEEHPGTPFGIRFSMNELSWYDRILSIPLYMAEYWRRFAEMIIESEIKAGRG